MHANHDPILIRALKRKQVARTPVWIMRQAGRYLPEYRQTRAKAGDFLSLCKNPQLACEVTLQPLRRYPLDAAIVFSDILTIPDAMGLGLYFVEGEGPAFQRPLRSEQAILQLPSSSVIDELAYVMDAVQVIRQSMPSHLPLIGFSGSPWTLACYMVEGQGSRDFKHLKKLIYNQVDLAQILLEKLTKTVSAYLSQQVKAGADVLMLFDTWGGLLTPHHYQQFSLQYMANIVTELKQQHPDVPIILFTKGGGQWLECMAATGCDALGLDWTCELALARKQVGGKVALQGNLDPAVLLADEKVIRQEVQRVLDSFGKGNGHIFNLGHGITPDVPPENLSIMLEAVHELSQNFHESS